MSKKYAVLVFGEYREFDYAHKTWTFLNEINYDLYFSTWNITEENNDLLNINIYEEVTKERILQYFPDATIDIRGAEDYGVLTTPINRMLFHWRNLFNMVTFSGKEYDGIILLRSDIYLNQKKSINNLLVNLKDDIIYGLSHITSNPPPKYLYVQDTMFIGRPEMLKWSLLTFRPPDVSFKNIHYHLSLHFLSNFIYVESIEFEYFDYYMMRSVNRNFMNESFETQKKLSEEWFDAKYIQTQPYLYFKLLNN